MKFSEACQGHVRVLTEHTVTEFVFLNLLILKCLFLREKNLMIYTFFTVIG